MSIASPLRSPLAPPPAPATPKAGCAACTSDRSALDRETESGQRLAHRGVLEQFPETLDGGALEPRLWYDKVVVLVLDRDKPQPVLARHALDRHAPIGALLRHGDGDCVVRFGL